MKYVILIYLVLTIGSLIFSRVVMHMLPFGKDIKIAMRKARKKELNMSILLQNSNAIYSRKS